MKNDNIVNREIKFRVWDETSSKIYNSNFSLELLFNIGTKKMLMKDISTEEIEQYDYLEHYIIMQYTGLKDKNGNEIYEGDCIESKTTGEGVKRIRVVEYDNKCSGFFYGNELLSDALFKFDIFEIVGNIFENPKLLKS